MSAQPFPTIDGHFWIERNGEIIDDDFKEYEFIKRAQGCSGEKKYKEADALTQVIITKMFDRALASQGLDHAKFREFCLMYGLDKPRVNCCFQNCVLRFQEGDTIKFGSMGWRKLYTNETHWEFGGEDWVGAKRFLK
jgi:hypothetical protein